MHAMTELNPLHMWHPYPWHLSQWQNFGHLLEQQKLPHAIMLAGPKDIGKGQLARALAYRILCESPAEGLACGRCRGCELNKAGTHPDLSCLSPEDGSRAIKVDQVREVTQFLSKTAQQGGYKLVIIDPAESMNTNSANALLKSLEEPSGKTLLILVCHNPGAVLPTIRSRCQITYLPMPGKESLISWLSPLLSAKSPDVEDLLIQAGGAPLAALALLEGDELQKRERRLQDWIKLSLGQTSAIEVAAEWQDEDGPLIVEWYLSWLLAISRWQMGASDSLVAKAPEEWRVVLELIAPKLLHRYLEKVLLTKRQLLSGANPNKQLLLEELLFDWVALMRLSRNANLVTGQL
jgi:DNA polymerase III subunit delta'